MWATNSLWFEIAIVSIIYALGNILMGHFEERTPKTRRVMKYVLTLLIVAAFRTFLAERYRWVFWLFSSFRYCTFMDIICQRKKGFMAGRVSPKVNTTNFANGTKTSFQNSSVVYPNLLISV
jgi:predicted MFS family arabinose efflux permease